MALGTTTNIPEDFTDKLTMRLAEEPSAETPLALISNVARAGAMGVLAAFQRAGQVANAAQATGNSVGSLRMLDPRLQSIAAEMFMSMFEPTQPGKVFLVNRPEFFAGLLTEVSRRLTEGVDITSTPIAPGLAQVSLTCREYGGPHDGTNPAPVGISDFAARRSEHDLLDLVARYLSRDYNAWIESVWTGLLMTSTNDEFAGVADGGASTGMTEPFDPAVNGAAEKEIRRGVRFLRERNIRPFSATGRYLCMVTPRIEEQLLLNSTFREASRYASTVMNPLWTGYIASFAGCDFVVSNFLPAATGGPTNALTTHPMIFVGANNPLAYGIGMPVEARMDPPTNFGRSLKFMWFQHAAYALLDARAVEIIHCAVE